MHSSHLIVKIQSQPFLQIVGFYTCNFRKFFAFKFYANLTACNERFLPIMAIWHLCTIPSTDLGVYICWMSIFPFMLLHVTRHMTDFIPQVVMVHFVEGFTCSLQCSLTNGSMNNPGAGMLANTEFIIWKMIYSTSSKI